MQSLSKVGAFGYIVLGSRRATDAKSLNPEVLETRRSFPGQSWMLRVWLPLDAGRVAQLLARVAESRNSVEEGELEA